MPKEVSTKSPIRDGEAAAHVGASGRVIVRRQIGRGGLLSWFFHSFPGEAQIRRDSQMFDFECGALHRMQGREIFVTERRKLGIAVYGPYSETAPGKYVAEFSVWIEPSDQLELNTVYSDVLCGYIDVCIGGGRSAIAKSYLYASRLKNRDRRYFLCFELSSPEVVEFRVYTNSQARLHIDSERRVRQMDASEVSFCPVLAPFEIATPFFVENFDLLKTVYENGGDISTTGQGVVASFNGVSCYIKNTEDFQIVNEIFLWNQYTFRSQAPKVIIDIGMNVGLATLRLASDPSVVAVHSFEPFLSPFGRAIENIALNPELKKKIFPRQFGLAGEDAELEVLASSDHTIGTSIRGIDDGVPEKIKIVDAQYIQGIIREARKIGADVFVKIDCEGSEFGIFQSLERCDLFKSIRGFMVEWHKWWSPDKNLEVLLEPLLRGGFVIFDRNIISDLFAGSFNAVRISNADVDLG